MSERWFWGGLCPYPFVLYTFIRPFPLPPVTFLAFFCECRLCESTVVHCRSVKPYTRTNTHPSPLPTRLYLHGLKRLQGGHRHSGSESTNPTEQKSEQFNRAESTECAESRRAHMHMHTCTRIYMHMHMHMHMHMCMCMYCTCVCMCIVCACAVHPMVHANVGCVATNSVNQLV